jgi:hypothetical protein
MSETVHYRGTLTKLVVGKDKIEAKAKEILVAAGKSEMPKYYDNWTEYLTDHFYDDYVVVYNTLFSVEKTEVGEEDVFNASETKDGYKFEVMYYNGGCSFDEALDIALGKIK